MKKFTRLARAASLTVALSAVLLAVLSPAGAQTAFVDGFDDLPLMPGLAQEVGRVVQFDSPYGRIIESWANGSLKAESVAGFYQQTLPQLGWVIDGPDRYHRNSDVLVIDIRHKGNGVEVYFRDAPSPKAP